MEYTSSVIEKQSIDYLLAILIFQVIWESGGTVYNGICHK